MLVNRSPEGPTTPRTGCGYHQSLCRIHKTPCLHKTQLNYRIVQTFSSFFFFNNVYVSWLARLEHSDYVDETLTEWDASGSTHGGYEILTPVSSHRCPAVLRQSWASSYIPRLGIETSCSWDIPFCCLHSVVPLWDISCDHVVQVFQVRRHCFHVLQRSKPVWWHWL